MPPIIAKLTLKPNSLGKLRARYGNLPTTSSFRYGPIGRAIGRGDIQALENRFNTLFGRLSSGQQQSILTRAVDEMTDVASLSERKLDDRILSVMVEDSQGDEIEVDLNGSIDGNRMVVASDDLIASGGDGTYRFNTPSGTVVVYNPEMDDPSNEMNYEDVLLTEGDSIQSAFNGRLAEHVVARALLMGEIIPEHRRIRMLSNIVVEGHRDFEIEQVYGGYLIPTRPSGNWVSLGDALPANTSREHVVRSNDDPIAKLLGSMMGGVVFDDSLFQEDRSVSEARVLQPRIYRRAIQKLEAVVYSLRAVGGVIDPMQVMINADDGEIWIDPDVEIHLLDHTMFTDGEGNIYDNPAAGVRNPYDPEASYVPSAELRSVANDALFFTVKDILWPRLDDQIREVVKKETARYITRYLFEHVGIEEAVRSVCAALDSMDPLEKMELLAFYDHLAGYLVAEFQRHADITSDATNEAAVDGVFRSLRNDLRKTVIPQRVLNNDEALMVYSRGRGVLSDLVNDPRNRTRWNNLIRSYLDEHGTRQISMFVSMVLPYIAYRNEDTPLNVFSDGHLFITRNFNPHADALRWSLLTEQCIPSPDPTEMDKPETVGEISSEGAGATVHHLFDFRASVPTSAGDKQG